MCRLVQPMVMFLGAIVVGKQFFLRPTWKSLSLRINLTCFLPMQLILHPLPLHISTSQKLYSDDILGISSKVFGVLKTLTSFI